MGNLGGSRRKSLQFNSNNFLCQFKTKTGGVLFWVCFFLLFMIYYWNRKLNWTNMCTTTTTNKKNLKKKKKRRRTTTTTTTTSTTNYYFLLIQMLVPPHQPPKPPLNAKGRSSARRHRCSGFLGSSLARRRSQRPQMAVQSSSKSTCWRLLPLEICWMGPWEWVGGWEVVCVGWLGCGELGWLIMLGGLVG